MRVGRTSPGSAAAGRAQLRPLPHLRRGFAALLALGCLFAAGCLFMPNRGTPVFVEARTGNYWSGEGLLLEVSEDQTRCLVAARDRALIVHERWVPCTAVHARRSGQ